MNTTSQVILRQLDALSGQRVLLVNPPADNLASELQQAGCETRLVSQDFAHCRALERLGLSTDFKALPEPLPGDETIILFLPREKELLAMLCDRLSSAQSSTSRLWLIGENRAGIKSSGKILQRFYGEHHKLDSARHCSLLEASQPLSDPFDAKHYETLWQLNNHGDTLELSSLPGVFANGRLDPGTRLLLDSLNALPLQGSILDFAAGCGVIGLALKQRIPDADVTLLEVSALALEAARRSAARNGLDVQLKASDGLSEAHGQYDWIVSNPPFHRGIAQTLDITVDFFRSAGTFLAQNGKIVIVCNRHLPYPDRLQELYKQVDRLAMNNEFLVLSASQPR